MVNVILVLRCFCNFLRRKNKAAAIHRRTISAMTTELVIAIKFDDEDFTLFGPVKERKSIIIRH